MLAAEYVLCSSRGNVSTTKNIKANLWYEQYIIAVFSQKAL